MILFRIFFIFSLFVLSACGGGDGASSSSSSLSTNGGEINCGEMSVMECDLFKKINEQRRINGVAPLSARTQCIRMAQSHSDDMTTNNFFSHDSPTQGSFANRSMTFQVGGARGENISMGYSDLDDVVLRWMNSPGHRGNILNASYQFGGIGISQNSQGPYNYTQVFSSACN
ncbi:CAP domain-containing protein [bacterium]|nr:CAP domain-containing protein [bacterium]